MITDKSKERLIYFANIYANGRNSNITVNYTRLFGVGTLQVTSSIIWATAGKLSFALGKEI